MTALAVGVPSPIVSVVDGQPITTSLDVAEYFGKQHYHVLRYIELLRERIGAERASTFGLTTRDVSSPTGGTRAEPIYRMTRDGFTLLAMGFTGKRALQFKLAYIDAFNRMEAELRGRSQPALPAEGAALLASVFAGERWLVSSQYAGQVSLRQLPKDAAIFSVNSQAEIDTMVAGQVPLALLPGLIRAAVDRLMKAAGSR